MWNVKTKAIPVIKDKNGTVSETFRQYLSNIEGKHEIRELRKQPYWALHIIRE
jgi:hypothetical protein